jgi:hypothetical protein
MRRRLVVNATKPLRPIRIMMALVAFATFLVLVNAGGVLRGQTLGNPERFTAFAVNTSTIGPSRTGGLEIVVSRWSTEEERNRMTTTLLDKGPHALLQVLQRTRRVGYIRTLNSIGYDLRFAQSLPGDDGGRRVILATDRPIGFWEASHQPRSIDYPFTLIELRLNSEGVGEGKLSIATRITGNRETGVIELEDYAWQPVLLMNVRSRNAT